MPASRVILLQFLLLLGLLLVLEGFARIGHTIVAGLSSASGAPSSWFEFAADVGWDRRPNFKGPDHCGKQRAFDANGLLSIDSEQIKSRNADTHVVLFVGDSNTYGLCVDTPSTFVEVVDRLLEDVQAINLGVNGYSSYQGLKTLLKYGEKLNPDTVVISFNYNDRRYAHNNKPDNDASFQELSSRTRKSTVLEQIYLFRLVRAVGKRVGLVRDRATAQQTKVRIDQLKPRVDPDSYRSNLIDMIQWARQRGSNVAFIIMGDNPINLEQLQKGLDHLAKREHEAGAKYLKYAADRPRLGVPLLARMHLSKAYLEMGLSDEAQDLSWTQVTPGLHGDGGAPILPDSVYNDVMLAVGKEYDVPVIDVRAKFRDVPRVYFDLIHFDVEGHDIIAEMVAATLRTLIKNRTKL